MRLRSKGSPEPDEDHLEGDIGPELDAAADVVDLPCLITTLPHELLSIIQGLVYASLTPLEVQLQRYHLAGTCRAFKQFFGRPSAGVQVADVERAIRLTKAIRSGRSTPEYLVIVVSGIGRGRGEKFAALLDACDRRLTDVTIQLDAQAMGKGAFGDPERDWFGVPLRRALAKVDMHHFKAESDSYEPTISVDILEEFISNWPSLELLEVGSLPLRGSRHAASNSLPFQLWKLSVQIESTDAAALVKDVLRSSPYSIYILHLTGIHDSGDGVQYIDDLAPAIYLKNIGHFCCYGGDNVNALVKGMIRLESLDLWTSAEATSSPLAILRTVPHLKSARIFLDSEVFEFSLPQLGTYIEESDALTELLLVVASYPRENGFAKWDPSDLAAVETVARGKNVKFSVERK
ncbi:hypothetical protein RQP46_007309 [Phenoliferia psychrophenolica]